MIVARVQVSGAQAHTIDKKVITAGMVGAQVQLEYTDPIWDSLQKTLVFYGAAVKDVITNDTLVTIPAEVIARKNVPVVLGVYGVDADGCVVIPTKNAELGQVQVGAKPSGDASTNPTLPVWAQLQAMIGDLSKLDTAAKNNLVAAVNEAITKGGGEIDEATVQRIVAEYLTANPPTVTERDPTVPDWAKQPQKPSYTALEVGADPSGTAASAVSQHNTDTAAHNDLRIALQALADRVNAVLDSDDVTLDQMSEVVAYIKSNKALIDAITTSKVSVGDIINDLVTNVADKPLSAAQGVVIKGLIEELRTLIPEAYTLPTATETILGGVKPVTATDAMTQPVGVTEDGRLVTKPGEGGGIAVTGATVGQTIRVAAVDDNGVPTAWEPVDLPEGEKEWKLITDITIAEEDASITLFITQDDNGNSFSYKEVSFAFIGIALTDGTASGKAWISFNATKSGYNTGQYGYYTDGYFYYTPTANYISGSYYSVSPVMRKQEGRLYYNLPNENIDIHAIEVSTYGKDVGFYGRVVIYGR